MSSEEMNEEIINAKYRLLSIQKGDEFLLTNSNSLRFIKDCEKSGFVILGIDFYKQQGDDIIELSCSADYSSVSYSKNAVQISTEAAIKLIKDGFPDNAMWASFTIQKSLF